MEPALKGHYFTYSDYEHINCVRLYLQNATLSNISDRNGQTINKAIMAGKRPNDRKSPRAWPRQPTVTKYQVTLWATYLLTHFVTKGRHLRRSLGQWTSDSSLEWRYTDRCTI